MKTSTRGAPTLALPLFWNCVRRRRLGSLSPLNHCFNSRPSELSACEVTSEWTRVAVVTRPFLLSRVRRWPHAIINVLLNKPQCIDDASERNVLLEGLFSNTWGGEDIGLRRHRLKWAEWRRLRVFFCYTDGLNIQRSVSYFLKVKLAFSSVRFKTDWGW